MNQMIKSKTRLVVKSGDEYLPLLIEDLVLIYKNDQMVWITDRNEKIFEYDKSLTYLEEKLDPQFFFRANRQYIINVNYVQSFRVIDKVRVQVTLAINSPEREIIISQKTAPDFRKWISGSAD
jgi:DNA-binding LytR/AlgR family response regulator